MDPPPATRDGGSFLLATGHRFKAKLWKNRDMELHSHLTEKTPRDTVLLAHGYAEHPGRYAPFIEYLNQQGADVWTFDFAGHGNDPGRRATVNVGRLIRQHLEARQQLESEARTPNLVLFGHSMGGLVTLASSILDPTHLRAVVASGPALAPLPHVGSFAAKAGQLLGTWFPGLKSVNLDDNLLSHDPVAVQAYREDPLVYRGRVPLLTGSSMVIQGSRVIDNAGAVTVPTLILHGSEDGLASPEGSVRFAAGAPEGLVDFRLIDGGYHEILNESDGDAVAAQIGEWLW